MQLAWRDSSRATRSSASGIPSSGPIIGGAPAAIAASRACLSPNGCLCAVRETTQSDKGFAMPLEVEREREREPQCPTTADARTSDPSGSLAHLPPVST